MQSLRSGPSFGRYLISDLITRPYLNLPARPPARPLARPLAASQFEIESLRDVPLHTANEERKGFSQFKGVVFFYDLDPLCFSFPGLFLRGGRKVMKRGRGLCPDSGGGELPPGHGAVKRARGGARRR